MEYWEFLIQKEGDRAWLPVEPPDVEILEGRYRVVARSSRTNTAVEICITHQSTTEIPPKRRTQKRFGQTNKDGLIVVTPFTRLEPGIWELRCTGDLMSDMMGEGWLHIVKLQVLPQTFGADEWEPEWDEAETAISDRPALRETAATVEASSPSATPQAPVPLQPPVISAPTRADRAIAAVEGNHQPVAEKIEPNLASASNHAVVAQDTGSDPDNAITSAEPPEAAIASEPSPVSPLGTATPSTATPSTVSSLLQQAEQMLTQVVDSVFQEFEAVEAAPSPGISATGYGSIANAAETAHQFQLVLSQETFVAHRSQPLTISGQVEAAVEGITAIDTPIELRIRLFDPQNTQALADVRQSLPSKALPIPFTCTLTVPQHRDTHLALGELILYDLASEAAELPVLATQSFTVTTDLEALLEAIADDFDDTSAEPPPIETPETESESDRPVATSLNLDFLQFLSQPQPEPQFQPAATHPLPPQIRQPDVARSTKSPELPSIGNFSTRINLPQFAASPLDTETAPAPANQDVQPPDEEARAPGDNAEATDAARSRLSDPSEAFELQPRGEAAHDPQPSRLLERPPSPEEIAFQSLKLQEKFLARLNALATDAESSRWLEDDDSDAIAPKSSEFSSTDDLDAENLDAEELDANDIELDADDIFNPADLDASDVDLEESASSSTVDAEWVADDNADFTAQSLLDAEEELVAQEIVVDDEPAIAPQTAPSPIQTEDIDEAVTIPTPILKIEPDELVAGNTATITLILPESPSQLYVKLWLHDRQMRSLLAGPHWIMDFIPDGAGNATARAQLTVPYGCLEIQVEAIAVSLTTHLESRKVTVDRLVLPPDLLELPLDELDI
jgi:hypothetical protein